MCLVITNTNSHSLFADNTTSSNYQGNHDYSNIDEEDELENENGNQGKFADDPRFTTFLLKVIDSDRLPVMFFEVQELDEDLVDEDGDGKGDHKPHHPRRHRHRRDKDHYGIPVSAFVKVLLTEEGDSPRHFQAPLRFPRFGHHRPAAKGSPRR